MLSKALSNGRDRFVLHTGQRGILRFTNKHPLHEKVRSRLMDGRNLALALARLEECRFFQFPLTARTAEIGNRDLEPDGNTTRNIIERCTSSFPAYRDLEILDVRVGLRPGRDEVRLECETLMDGRTVIHNYGHGGAGFTVGWGCAMEVAELLEQHHP